MPHQNNLHKNFNKKVSDLVLDYSQAFSSIEFSDSFKEIKKLADRTNLPNEFVAIHLRSGDMVYGEPRKWGLWGNKVISIPIVMKIIELYQAQDKNIIVFGQDLKVIEFLKNRYGLLASFDYTEKFKLNSTELCFYEILLMSKAKEIVAGNSGFSRIASFINGSKLLNQFDFYNSKKYSEITYSFYEKNINFDWNVMQAAYDCFLAYAYARTEHTFEYAYNILKKAFDLDPSNEMFQVLSAALCYKNKKYLAGEYLVEKALCNCVPSAILDANFLKIVSHKFPGSDYSFKEYFNFFIDSAILNYPYASLISYKHNMEGYINIDKNILINNMKKDKFISAHADF